MADVLFTGSKGEPINKKTKSADVERILAHVQEFLLSNAEEAEKGNADVFGELSNTNVAIKSEMTSLTIPGTADAPPSVRDVARYHVVWYGPAHGTELTDEELSRPDSLSPGRIVVLLDIKHQRFLFAYERRLLSEAHAKAAKEGEIAFLSCKKAIGLALLAEFPNLLSTDESKRGIDVSNLKVEKDEDRLIKNILKRMIIHMRIAAQKQLDDGKLDTKRGIIAPTVILIPGMENLYSNITWKDLGLVAPSKGSKREATSTSSLLESVAAASETKPLTKPTTAPTDGEEKSSDRRRRRTSSSVKEAQPSVKEAQPSRKRKNEESEGSQEKKTIPTPAKRRSTAKVVEKEKPEKTHPSKVFPGVVRGTETPSNTYYNKFLSLAMEAEDDLERLKAERDSYKERVEELEENAAAGGSSAEAEAKAAKMKKVAQNFKKKFLAEQEASTAAKAEVAEVRLNAEKEAAVSKKTIESCEKKLAKTEARADALKKKLVEHKRFAEEALVERNAESLAHTAEISSLQKKIVELTENKASETPSLEDEDEEEEEEEDVSDGEDGEVSDDDSSDAEEGEEEESEDVDENEE